MSDRLVYEVKDHPTRLPTGRVTEDGHYLVITQVDGYEKNGVELLDLRKPGASVQPLLMDWDALYNFIGSRGDELYFHTTSNAPLGQVIAVDARQGADAAHGSAGRQRGHRAGELRGRPHRRELRGRCPRRCAYL